MPYKLKKMNDDTPAELFGKFNMTAANSKGIVFKNRVPVVNNFPESFTRIDIKEYNKILNDTKNRY